MIFNVPGLNFHESLHDVSVLKYFSFRVQSVLSSVFPLVPRNSMGSMLSLRLETHNDSFTLYRKEQQPQNMDCANHSPLEASSQRCSPPESASLAPSSIVKSSPHYNR